jgi:hypothetical protein
MEQRRRNSSGAEGDAGGVLWSQPAEPRCCEDRVAAGLGPRRSSSCSWPGARTPCCDRRRAPKTRQIRL